jgi:ubiquinone/menaquinone biosynthesis C-methylase UbiE
MMMGNNRQEVVEQVCKQTARRAQVRAYLELLVEVAQASNADRVLDVACGGGLVASEFARHCAQVTGVDLDPAMLGHARNMLAMLQLPSISWVTGDALRLPFRDETFSLVVTRYSLHHFPKPEKVLREMIRVCRPGGRVLVADMVLEPETSAAFDRMERMFDPGHHHALTTVEFSELFSLSGLSDCRRRSYGVEIELESQLRASSPSPGDQQILREIINEDIGRNLIGVQPRLEGGEIVYTIPIMICAGVKGGRAMGSWGGEEGDGVRLAMSQ